jgi:hypothetical protein
MPAITRNYFLLLVLSVVLPSFIPVHLSATVQKETVTVKVFSRPTQSASSPNEVASFRIEQAFTNAHPHIKLESGTKLRIAGHGEETGVLMSIAGGTAPDVLRLNFRMSDTYLSRGFLYPLDKYKLFPSFTALRRAARTEPLTIGCFRSVRPKPPY